ncbi:MAG: hypothetical protein FJW20_04830 [Acidimicrobiia bacterium]|nr:hypothetical protein [Acidimicrobiia bacterium]
MLVLLLMAALAAAQVPQNPSPMVDTTRAHERLSEQTPPGERHKLSVGTLYLPPRLKRATAPLLIHFHGPGWIAEAAGSRMRGTAVISIELGQGSAAYAKPFRETGLFEKLVEEAEAKAETKFTPITLSSWSAGYGAVREILRVPGYYERVNRYIALDSIHAGYVSGKADPANVDVFLQFARDAVEGKKEMLLTHSEVFPGTYASTTEVVDCLLEQLKLKRKAVLKWGPLGMQQLSEVKAGKLEVMGFAGNSAPDHVDHMHAFPELGSR